MQNSTSRRHDTPERKRDSDTIPVQGPVQQPTPRMPHERDESADNQPADEPSARRMGELGREDVERGVVDTDKGPVLDETYEKLRQDLPNGEKKFSP